MKKLAGLSFRIFIVAFALCAWPAGAQHVTSIGGAAGATSGWRVLKQVNVRQTVVTGTTAKTNSYLFTVPGGTLGASGRLKVTAIYRFTGTAGTKTIGVDFGGTTFYSPAAFAATNLAQAFGPLMIANRDSASIQIATLVTSSSGFGGTNTDVVTGSINTAADQALALWVTLADGADSGAIESVLIEFNNDAP